MKDMQVTAEEYAKLKGRVAHWDAEIQNRQNEMTSLKLDRYFRHDRDLQKRFAHAMKEWNKALANHRQAKAAMCGISIKQATNMDALFHHFVVETRKRLPTEVVEEIWTEARRLAEQELNMELEESA